MEVPGLEKLSLWHRRKAAGLMKWKMVSHMSKVIKCRYFNDFFIKLFLEAIYKEKLLLPTAPRAARGSDIDESRIPNNAPYTAYIANLPYDIEVEDVSKFFHGLSVRS